MRRTALNNLMTLDSRPSVSIKNSKFVQNYDWSWKKGIDYHPIKQQNFEMENYYQYPQGQNW